MVKGISSFWKGTSLRHPGFRAGRVPEKVQPGYDQQKVTKSATFHMGKTEKVRSAEHFVNKFGFWLGVDVHAT